MTNRKVAIRLGVTCLAVVLAGSIANGGAGRHDRTKAQYVEFAKQFPAVGSVYGLGTGTLIAPQWVLTCAHGIEIIGQFVPDKSRHVVELAGAKYRIAEVVHHPKRKPMTPAMMMGGNGEHDNAFDILLLRLADRVTGVKPLALYTGNGESGCDAAFVGCGTWVPDGSVGLSLGEADRGKRGVCHAGTNRIDAIDAEGRLKIDFTAPDQGATDLEMGFSAGDSGGPMLVKVDGDWMIAGVASQGGEDLDLSKGIGRYGDQILGTRVSEHADWIQSTIRAHAAGR